MDNLPSEIVAEICKYLRTSQSDLLPLSRTAAAVIPASTLWSLSLCNKRLNHLLTPILYADFSEHGSVRKLPLFLRTTLESEYLPQFVKSFAGTSFQRPPWGGVSAKDNRDDWAERALDTSIWSRIDRLAVINAINTVTRRFDLAKYSDRRPDPTFSKRWLRRIFSSTLNYTWDAIVALILCLLPNLEAFSVNIYNDDRHGIKGFGFIFRVLMATKQSGNRAIQSRVHHIHLSFTNCLVRPILLRNLMLCFGPLESFSYEVLRPRNTHRAGSRRPTNTTMGGGLIKLDILAKLPQSIEKLTLSIRHGHGYGATDFWNRPYSEERYHRHNPGLAKTLSTFPNLKVLRASAFLLLGDPYLFRNDRRESCYGSPPPGILSFAYLPEQEDEFLSRLPPIISHLIIKDCSSAVYASIQRFLEGVIGVVPKSLSRIEIVYAYPSLDPGQYDPKLMAMRDRVRATGRCVVPNTLEDLAKRSGVVLVQRLEENYRKIPNDAY